MIKFIKKLFSIPLKNPEKKLLEIQAQMNEQQDAMLRHINQITETLDNNSFETRAVFQAVQMCGDQVIHLEEMLRDLEKRQRLMSEQIESRLGLLNQDQDRLNEQFHQTEEEVHEIRNGDLFRRIEFIQGKQVRLENILQRNLLSMEDQIRSEEYRFITRMRALFPVEQVVSEKSFARIGRNHDGGYLMLDDFEEKKIAYSIGIADDISWDQDMVNRGLDVYMYDHTIEGLPYEHDKFHYFKIGLGAKTNPLMPQLKTLYQMMTENGHLDTYGMILKIDIEGAEWDFLNEVDEVLLSHFSQIVFEFHGLIFCENEGKMKSAMDKLNKTHQLVHLHPNNYGSYLQVGGKVLPELIEGTYLLKSEYAFTREAQSFPTAQDETNSVYLPDIYLGNWDT
jgi:hypothetical protein